VAVALFVIDEAQMTIIDFVEFVDLLKAGHATQPQCYPEF
jgi:hypothetical protein